MPQVLEARLANPGYHCGSAELGGLRRGSCYWPFRCCNKLRLRSSLTEHGSPPSRDLNQESPDGKKKRDGGDPPTPITKRAKRA